MVTKASKVQAKPPTANRQRDGRRRTRSARTASAVAVRHYGTFSIRVVKSAFAKNLQNNALTHIRASIENRTEAVHSACDTKSEEHRRRRQEVKSARSGQSNVYAHAQFWTQTVTFSRCGRLGHDARSLEELPAGGKQPTSESSAASPACASAK